jgi:hypothetical protein
MIIPVIHIATIIIIYFFTVAERGFPGDVYIASDIVLDEIVAMTTNDTTKRKEER